MSAEPVRIQKFLADAGLCSRRAAEELVRSHDVWVNGACAELGQRITPGVDKVTVAGQVVRPVQQPRVTLVVHKPRGLVCTNSDPHGTRTVFELVPPQFAKLRFFCAGRLDKESEGLVILTTDGDLAHRLMHPVNRVVKRYYVQVEQPFPSEKIERLTRGITWEGERLQADYAALVNPSAGKSTRLDVHLHHGRKREIRHLFLALGYEVKRLKRYQIGAFRLAGIPARAGKILQPRDIESLFASPPAVPLHARKTAARREKIAARKATSRKAASRKPASRRPAARKKPAHSRVAHED